MDTTSRNRVVPSNTVTPDAVVQPNPSLGFVAEAKKSLPSNDDYWRKIASQLEKYDDDLIGWWTADETIENLCIVLLIEISRAASFRRYLNKLEKEEHLKFNKPLSLIEFSRSSEAQEYLFLRKHWGQIQDQALSGILEDGKKIPIEKMLVSYGEKKFYDSEPPTEHTMYILWQDIFNEMKARLEYDDKRKAWPLSVNVDALTNDLQNLYGSLGGKYREVTFPRIQWVRNALDAFVTLDLAKRENENGDYLILFKPINGDVIGRFAKHRKKSQKQAKQLPLPLD